MTEAPALQLDRVSRVFGSRGQARTAVCEVSLDVPRGKVVCVLGPNGAGKTTSIKMAATLLEPTSGSVRVAGIDAVRHPRAARTHIGLVLGGERGFYLRATARENLTFFANLVAIPRQQRAQRIEQLLEYVGLADRAHDRVEAFSRGMRQRLHIARALLADPALLLLDEPSIGLDPEGARELREIVRRSRGEGSGILLTTHYLEEANDLADEFVVIAAGRVVARGSAADIARLGEVDRVTTFFARRLPEAAVMRLRAAKGVTDVVVRERGTGYECDVIWTAEAAHQHDLMALLGEAGRPDGAGSAGSASETAPEWVTHRPVTLEEAYLAFIARVHRGEAP